LRALADELPRLLAQSPDPRLRQIACWKLEGYTNADIAARIDRSEVTVERKLKLIRTLWPATDTADRSS
jgi:DNA-binding NarL/FixJ family response regulator